jgi:hypothetical protein
MRHTINSRVLVPGAEIHEMAALSSEELAQRKEFRGAVIWHTRAMASR